MGIYVTREMSRLKAIYRDWAIPAPVSRYMRHATEWSGLRRSRKPVYVVVRNFITCSSTPWRHCARECDGNS